MTKLVYFVGDNQGGISNDYYPEDYSLAGTVFEEPKPVRAADLTLIEQNQWLKLRDHIRQTWTSGFYKAGQFFFGGNTVSGVLTAFPANTFGLAESWANERGRELHIGNPDNPSDTNPLYTTITLPAPPVSGTRTDIVYLEVWEQEISGVGSTDAGGVTLTDKNLYKYGGVSNGIQTTNIYWGTPANVEPVRRIQLRWALRAYAGQSTIAAGGAQGGAGAPNGGYPFTALETITLGDGTSKVAVYQAGSGDIPSGQALKSVDGYVYAMPIALVARSAGNTTIISSNVTDIRNSMQLQSGLIVNQTNIFPSLAIDPTFGHLGTAHFVYSGEQAAGNTHDALTSYHLYQSAYASRFRLQKANQIAPEGAGSVFGPIRRVTLPLYAVGTGANVVVEIHADGTTLPAGLLASATIPAAWITSSVRDVSAYINLPNLVDGGYYWVVVKMGGSSTNHAVIMGNNAVPPSGIGSIAANDGVTFTTTQIGPIGYGIYTGTSGVPVHAFVNSATLYLYEYNVNGTIAALGEYYTPSAGHGNPYSKYSIVGYSTDALTITDIG